MKQTFLSIGECMVEMAPNADGHYSLGFAGDTFNTAWYARQLFDRNWDIAYLTAVGQDLMSDQMVNFINNAGINTSFVQHLEGCTVGLYMIQLENGERSFAYWRSDSAARRLANDPARLVAGFGSANVIYFSGITLAILSLCGRSTLFDAIVSARQKGATVVFDPNLRLRLWDSTDTMRQTIMQAASISDIVLPSYEDEAMFFGDETPDDTARRYAGAGVTTVVVKNAGDKAVCLCGGEFSRFTPERVDDVVDTTAAGDSFNAGFLATYLDTEDLRASMSAGAKLAARVISERGALIKL